MRRILVILAVAAAATAVVAALRRRCDDPSDAVRYAEQPERADSPDQSDQPDRPERPARPRVGDDAETEAAANRFVTLAADEQARRHEAAERLKADLAGR